MSKRGKTRRVRRKSAFRSVPSTCPNQNLLVSSVHCSGDVLSGLHFCFYSVTDAPHKPTCLLGKSLPSAENLPPSCPKFCVPSFFTTSNFALFISHSTSSFPHSLLLTDIYTHQTSRSLPATSLPAASLFSFQRLLLLTILAVVGL